MGMIVQLPIVCTDRMKPLQQQCLDRSTNIWFANFDDRPSRLFDGLQHIRATIFTCQKGTSVPYLVYSTSYNRWYSEFRPQLFEMLSFAYVSPYLVAGAIPKIGHVDSKRIWERIANFSALLKAMPGQAHGDMVYFHNAPQYWVRAMDFIPYFWNERDGEQISTQVKTLRLQSDLDAAIVVAALNSSLFYWWFIILSDCRHLNMREIENFPLGLDTMKESEKSCLAKLTLELMADFKRHKIRRECQYKTTGKVVYDEFYPRLSKPIIDEIDKVLAKHYGFTDEELDFIINYDIKYRMGIDGDKEE